MGWRQGRDGGYGGGEFGLGGENGVWRAVRIRGRHGVVWGLGRDKRSSAVRVYPQLFLHYPNTRHTLPTKSQSHTPTQPTYRIHHSPNPHPSRPYMPIPPQRLSLVLIKSHMSLWRFCCALIIEYKCKTSNINKRL